MAFTLCQWAETLAGKLDPSRTASIIKDLKIVNVSDPDVHRIGFSSYIRFKSNEIALFFSSSAEIFFCKIAKF